MKNKNKITKEYLKGKSLDDMMTRNYGEKSSNKRIHSEQKINIIAKDLSNRNKVKQIEDVEKEIMNTLKIEKFFCGGTYYLEIKSGMIKQTLECHIRDNIRYFQRTISSLKFNEWYLGKGNDKEIKIVIKKFKSKLKEHQQYLLDLKLN